MCWKPVHQCFSVTGRANSDQDMRTLINAFDLLSQEWVMLRMDWLWENTHPFLHIFLSAFLALYSSRAYMKTLQVLLPRSWASLLPEPWMGQFSLVSHPICYFAVVAESRLKQFKITLSVYSAAWNRAMQTTVTMPKLHSVSSSHSHGTKPAKKCIHLVGFCWFLLVCLLSLCFTYLNKVVFNCIHSIQ